MYVRTQKKRGRPSAEQKQANFNWAAVEEEDRSGTREEAAHEYVPLCKEDFIDYFQNSAPKYQRC